jgi:hypothetical protein
MIMIDALRRYSSSFAFLKPVTLVLMAGAIVLSGYLLVVGDTATSDFYLMPSVVVFMWSSTLYIMIVSFPNVPVSPSKDLTWFKRVVIRFKRLGYHLLSYVFLLVSVAALYMGYSLLKIGFTA